MLAVNQEVLELAAHFVKMGALPQKAEVDPVHVAAAAVHGMDFLVTWNCSHIANAVIRARLESLCRTFRLEPPTICTPEELLMTSSGIADPIVEEVRAIRDAYARSLNYDLTAVVADLQARQAEHAHLIVTLPPKRIEDA